MEGQNLSVFEHISGSATLMVGTLMSYLYFVKVCGPKYMAKKRPYDLKYTMMASNLVQVLANAWLLLRFIVQNGGLKHLWYHSCYPPPPEQNWMREEIVMGYRVFYFLKIGDLLDTVIFVLRKKDNQISVLHLAHHTLMIIATWLTLNHFPEDLGIWLAVNNTTVHVVMHLYYLLAALGPSVQKYLWWKEYITRLQIEQFLIMLTSLSYVTIKGCNIDPKFTILWGLNVFLFLVLFVEFYREKYVVNKKRN